MEPFVLTTATPREALVERIRELEADNQRLRDAVSRRGGWTSAEEEILRHGCERRYAFETIRAELIAKGYRERSTSNLRYRAKELGVAPTRSVNLWTEAEDAIVRDRYAAGDKIRQIRLALLDAGFHRKFNSIQMRMIHLGISGGRSTAWTPDEERIALAGLTAGKLFREILVDLDRSGFSRTLASLNKLAKKHDLRRPQRPWTEAEKAKLREIYQTDLPVHRVAEVLDRPVPGVIAMASKLGLPRRERWRADENDTLIAAAKDGRSLIAAAREIGRPYANVAQQARRLGLSFQKRARAA